MTKDGASAVGIGLGALTTALFGSILVRRTSFGKGCGSAAFSGSRAFNCYSKRRYRRRGIFCGQTVLGRVMRSDSGICGAGRR